MINIISTNDKKVTKDAGYSSSESQSPATSATEATVACFFPMPHISLCSSKLSSVICCAVRIASNTLVSRAAFVGFA